MKVGDRIIKWFEIPVNDFKRAKQFYETVFEIEMEERELGDAVMGFFPYDQSKGTIGGAICKGPGYLVCHKGPKLYLNGDPDLTPVINRVPDAGGEILVPKSLITPEVGYMAVFKDTEGNHIYLHSQE